MIIDLKNLPLMELANFKGGEGAFHTHMFTDEAGNRFMLGHLDAGDRIGTHVHSGNCEIIFAVEGEGRILFDGEELVIKAGECHYCPEGHSHSFAGAGETGITFYACVINN